MPKVPEYESQIQPTATPDARLNLSVNPNQFGASVGRGVANLGQGVNALSQNIQKMQAEDDAIAATEAFNNASEEAREYLHGENGAYSQQGKNASGLHDQSKTAFEEIYNRHSGELQNDNQRRAFTAMWGRRTNTNLDNVARHEARERKVYFENTQKASIQGAANHAQNNFDKPDEIQNSLIEVETIIRSNPAGDSAIAVDEKVKQARSLIHKSVVDRMMVNDPAAAKEYYKQNKDSIEGEHHRQIEAGLKSNVNKRAAQEAADKILLNDKLSDQQKRAEAKKIDDADVRAMTEALVAQDIANRKTDRIEFERQVSEFFWNGFIANPDPTTIPDNLPPDEKLKALKYAMNPTRKTDLAIWYQINELSIKSPDEFQNLNLMKFVTDLDETDFQAFAKLQRTIKTGDKQTLTHIQGISAKANKALKAAGIKQDSDRGQMFMRMLQDDVSLLETSEGRKIKPDEVDAAIDRLLIEGEVEGLIVDPDKFSFEVEPGERFFIEDVPADERRKIIKAYKNRGITPTEEQIVDLYTKKRVQR